MMHWPTEMAQKMVSLGNDWADKDAAASLLEETRKSLRAEIAGEYIAEGKKITHAELLAESDRQYKLHLEKMVEARRVATRAKINFEAHRVLIDLQRTAEATKRQELKTLGG